MHAINVTHFNEINDKQIINEPYYIILLLKFGISCCINGVQYHIPKNSVLFTSPYQQLKLDSLGCQQSKILRFHGDFYCIEYHKKEVACNGILFNNIYSSPYVSLDEEIFQEVSALFEKIEPLQHKTESFNAALLKAYLQVILALNSKQKQQDNLNTTWDKHTKLAQLKEVINQHFYQERTVAFYANYFGYSTTYFSKKTKGLYGKTFSKLIEERVILEAKKLLHLTYQSIQHISEQLGFEDVFYFSRYFKKSVGVSPSEYRSQVGIAAVAKKSIE